MSFRDDCFLVASLALALRPAADAADLQSWNTAEFTLVETPQLSWTALGSVRLRNQLSEAYDNYLVTLVRKAVTRRVGVFGGCLYRRDDIGGGDFHNEYRVLMGPVFRLAERPLRVEAFTQFERLFLDAGRADYNRYRERVQIEKLRRGVSPFLSEELLFDPRGFVRTRSFLGGRWRFRPDSWLELGYQFESILTGPAWAPRHAVRTAIHLGPLHRGQ